MVHHVVMSNFKPGVSSAQRDDGWPEMSRRLHSDIKIVRAFSIGPDLLRLPRSHDVALVADFGSLEDVRSYLDHRSPYPPSNSRASSPSTSPQSITRYPTPKTHPAVDGHSRSSRDV